MSNMVGLFLFGLNMWILVQIIKVCTKGETFSEDYNAKDYTDKVLVKKF